MSIQVNHSTDMAVYSTIAVAEIAAKLRATGGSEPVQLDPHLWEYFSYPPGFVQVFEEQLSSICGTACGTIYDEARGIAFAMSFAPIDPQPVAQQPATTPASTNVESDQPVNSGSGPRNTRAAAISDKPPRPMNCWMLYRDSEHKKIKAAHPEMSVQEISMICSGNWKTLPETEKKYWRDEAAKAKELHAQQFPDYKYSPRKPGEKKKRQSRKAKQAAARDAEAQRTATLINEPTLFDFNAFTPLSMTNDLSNPFVTADTAADPFSLDAFDATLHPDMVHEPQTQGLTNDEIRQAESARQVRLEAEFGTNHHVDAGDDTLAFRNGANEGATLPAIYPDFF